jgi:hypothetical protein
LPEKDSDDAATGEIDLWKVARIKLHLKLIPVSLRVENSLTWWNPVRFCDIADEPRLEFGYLKALNLSWTSGDLFDCPYNQSNASRVSDEGVCWGGPPSWTPIAATTSARIRGFINASDFDYIPHSSLGIACTFWHNFNRLELLQPISNTQPKSDAAR